MTYTHMRSGKVLATRILPLPVQPLTAAQQLAGLGGSTDHEKEAAASGQVAACCDSVA